MTAPRVVDCANSTALAGLAQLAQLARQVQNPLPLVVVRMRQSALSAVT
jgi:hypothetical protein